MFISWDDDGSGTLEANEIIKPLISLGLAPNSEFAILLLQALDPKTKKNNKKPRELSDLKFTLQDFIKIFRGSKVSECLFNLISKESEKRLRSNFHPMPLDEMPNRRFEHPGVANAASSDDENCRESQQDLDD